MRPVKPDVKPQIVIDVHQYELTAREENALRSDLDAFSRLIANFPVADFRVYVEGNARTKETSVKLTLLLPGATLVVNDRDIVLHAAFERCIDSLRNELQAYKDRLSRVPDRQKISKGTYRELQPSTIVDTAELDRAVEAGDYPAFRAATMPFEEELRNLTGRWVQRYPEIDARIDETLKIADIVEEVFLLAFERYPRRPSNVSLGTWLQDLIDPAVKELTAHQGTELENIALVRTACEAAINSERPSQ